MGYIRLFNWEKDETEEVVFNMNYKNKMIAIKTKNLIVQMILTVISLVVNLIVVVPVVLAIGLITSGEWKEAPSELGINTFIFIPLMFVVSGVGFALNRLLFRIKGKEVDVTYLVWKEEYDHTEEYYDSWKNTLTITDYYKLSSEYESELTGLGWLATFLSFIAFPMRLVSLIMAFAAMFTDHIFVTHRRLNPDMPVSKSAVFTHTLFDFVIMPKTFSKVDGVRSKKSIAFIISYVILFVIFNLLALRFLGGRTRYDWADDWATLVSLLMGIIVFIVDLILLIKHSILLGKAYTLKKALITIVKIVIPPLVWLIFNLVFFE